MLTHALSAAIETDDRMPKPTEEDREGYCLCRMVPRYLKQYNNWAHATSPLLQLFTAERSAPIGKVYLVEVWALARGVGVTREWSYTRYNCYFRVSATKLMPVLEGRTTISRDIRSWPNPNRIVPCFAAVHEAGCGRFCCRSRLRLALSGDSVSAGRFSAEAHNDGAA